MRRKRNRRNYDLKTVLPILLLAALLVAGIVGTIVSWRQTVRETLRNQTEDLEHRTTILNDEITRQLSILDGYGASFTRENLADHDALVNKLDQCAKRTEFSYVCFAYPDGRLYRNDGVEVQVNHRYYFQQTLQGAHVVEFLENSAIDPTNRIGMSVPVTLDGRIEGLLLGLYDKISFQAFFERNYSTDSLTYICDANGNLLLGTVAGEQALAAQDLAIEGGSFLQVLGRARFSSGSLEQTAADMAADRGGQAEYSFGGRQRYTTYLPLGVNDWYVVSVLYTTQVYENVIGATGLFYLIIFAAMLAMLALIIYLLMRERRLAKREKEKFDHDALTGLLTEKAFLERVNGRLEGVWPGEFCLVYLDIYKFKLINEMFGYDKGDELLCATAAELNKFAGQCGGLCGRISGDSFALFIPHKEELIREFNTKKYRKKRIVPLDLYLHYGIYVIRETAVPADRMMDAARLAQKTVKGNYDNCIAYYDERIKQTLLKEQEIITSMAAALENGEFIVYLQPQYNYRSGVICGAEALVRWNSPEKGLIPPGVFIPIFETNGFIIRLDEYVWEQACKLQRKWLDEKRPSVPLSVNVSRADLLKGAIAEKLTSLIQKYDLTPNLIRVEITESAYMDNPQQLIQEINWLTECGFTVEMDDFGSGYSSLNMLKDVPFHVLKTDLKFLSATGIGSRKDRILDNVIRMAHEMGMSVIAEGVETKEQADNLLALNCEQMQGYYFAKPLPVEEFEALLAKQ